ncbi:MAG TPA: translation elongation factor Ts [Firmicutes bacterium]|nr:translation elongation factor Ts [Bacillota bacterium]
MANYKPTAVDIKNLRDKTLAGFQDCQKALTEANGDMAMAEDIIRKKGLQVAAKKAHREASEGLVVARISDDKSSGALIEVNCETDFVCKTDSFKGLTEKLADHIFAKGPEGYCEGPDLYDSTIESEGGKSVKIVIDETIGQIGENMGLKRIVRYCAQGPGVVHAYIHPPGKIGVIIEVGCANDSDKDKCDEIAHELALQVAFADPSYIAPKDIPPDILAKEKEIAEAKAREQGKPEHIVPKIAEGILRKYYAEECLLEQPYAKEPKINVKDFIKQTGVQGVEVRRFARFSLK